MASENTAGYDSAKRQKYISIKGDGKRNNDGNGYSLNSPERTGDKGQNCVLATTWEWEEDIDAERAEAARHRAEQALANGGLTDKEYRIAEAKLQRALVRLSVKE